MVHTLLTEGWSKISLDLLMILFPKSPAKQVIPSSNQIYYMKGNDNQSKMKSLFDIHHHIIKTEI